MPKIMILKYLRQWHDMAGRVYTAGLPHLLLSILVVQGLTYLSQFILARLMSPADFGIIRSIEAVIGIAVIIGSLGMPTLAVKSIAETKDPVIRSRLLGRLIKIALVASFFVVLLMMGIGIKFLVSEARPYFTSMIWVICLTATGRTLINFFQGINQFQKMSVVNASLAFLSLSVLTGLVLISGIKGWLWGRYLGEGLFLAGGLVMVGKNIQFSGNILPEYSYKQLIPEGLTVSSSLIVRSVLDSLPLFILGYSGQASQQIGFYGLSALIITCAGILPGGIVSLALPRMVERLSHSINKAWVLYMRILRWTLASTLFISLMLITLSPGVVLVFGKNYQPAIPILIILSLSFPFRALTSLAGAFLLSCGQVRITLWLNMLFLVFTPILLLTALKIYGVTGLAWSVVLAEMLSMVFYLLAERKIFQNRSLEST